MKIGVVANVLIHIHKYFNFLPFFRNQEEAVSPAFTRHEEAARSQPDATTERRSLRANGAN